MNHSDKNFIDKVASLAAQAGKEVVKYVLILFYAAQHPDVPIKAKMLIPAALAYFILPLDAIPDVLPGVGYSDDLGVLIAAVGAIMGIITDPNAKNSIMKSTKQMMKKWFGDDEDDSASPILLPK